MSNDADQCSEPAGSSPHLERVIGEVARVTKGTPYEGRLFVVGGRLRDELLGRDAGADVDMVLEGDALELAGFLFRAGVSSIAPVTFPRFGTAMLRVGEVDLELVGARQESYQPDSRKPDVQRATVHQDALRRDFTINTLLRNLHTGEWIDPTGLGFADIASKTLRTPLDPDQTFFDDPLRMLRAARFAAQLGFNIEPAVSESIRKCGFRLEVISKERIRDEWNKLLLSPRPALGVALLQELDLLNRFLPALSSLASRPGRGLEEWTHTLRLVDALASVGESLQIRLAAVLHHSGSALDIRQWLTELRYPGEIIGQVALLVQLRERVAAVVGTESPGTLRRLVRDAGSLFADLMQLCNRDQEAGDPELKTVNLDNVWTRIADLERIVPSNSLESPLDGQEIMETLGIPAGPAVKVAKEGLLDDVLEGRLAPGDREGAMVRLLRSLRGPVKNE